jgi:hypothetical protein
MKPITVTVTSAASKIIAVDRFGGDVSVAADYEAGTSYTVQYTLKNIHDPIVYAALVADDWHDVTDMTAATSNTAKSIKAPICGLKLTHAGTNSTVFDILQASAP